MAEVGAAAVAGDFGAEHAEAAVDVLVDQVLVVRAVEARPAAARVELGFGAEERCVAADAAVGAGVVAVPVDAGEGAFGALAAGYLVLEFVQLLAPFGVGLVDSGHGFSSIFRVDRETGL